MAFATRDLHPLLRRQLRRLRLDPADPPGALQPWQALLEAVGQAYDALDESVHRTRRAERQAAAELARANRELRDERDNLESHVRERTVQLEQSQADLLESQRLAGLGSWSFQPGDTHIEVSEQLALMLGLTREQFPDSLDSLLRFVVDEDRTGATRTLESALRGPIGVTGELRLRAADGSVRWYACTIASHADESGAVVRVRGAMFDVTARRTAESRVQRLAYNDELTGLPNRARFMEFLADAQVKARSRGSRFGLLFLDLDGFKEINDSLGHDAGDELLQQVAQRIRACLRQADRLARFGGDEFLVLIDPVRRRKDVELVTRKILQAVSTPLKLQGLVASVSASIGIAIYPDDGDDPQRLLKNADAAMYQAKQNGRNAMEFYAPEINASLLERLALINDLRGAVTRAEITVAYQPICDGRTGRIHGLEALARWSHPERGAVSPSRFIALAEETGLIGAIGAGVLARACEQMVRWGGMGPQAPYLSANVSPVQLRDAEFVSELRALLAACGLPPSRLQLELTEGTVMENPRHAAAVLRELSQMGIRIALDDFGTGHSSLAYLREFAIDCIKIDRSFVKDLGRPGRDEPIVPAIIAIARSLGATVVAEGVETEAQRDALLALGCAGMQGYLFSRPLPAAEIEPRLPGAAPGDAARLDPLTA
jgi:diguanylate cyclase (GGDEF)-like protein/PAS domain S-box-containing protein